MRLRFIQLAVVIGAVFSASNLKAQPMPRHNLYFSTLATRWDDGMPLGNGWLGELVWQKGNNIRLSLDRVDLWDDRPMPEIDKLTFKWVQAQVSKGQYDTVQKIGDDPYEKYAAPTKIPAAALEFNCSAFGKVVSNELNIKSALNIIKFENGVVFNNYVHAVNEVGYFGFENIPGEYTDNTLSDLLPQLITPNYTAADKSKDDNSHAGDGLQLLGYTKGIITKTSNSIRYHQPTYGKNYYEVLVQWKRMPAGNIIGSWTISLNKKAVLLPLNPMAKEPTGWPSHIKWWTDFWNQSAVSLPDAVIEKQYYLEMYKIGCVARNNTPPISLQAIWTADNGSLPPWKGDIHHDLNTELSYWPLYSGNHLQEAGSFTNWLWKVKAQNRKWTKKYFGIDGLNVPGVTTITGKEMGGWIQYSMSPTTATWLTHHFYLQWKYGMDKQFLLQKCKPYFDEVHQYLKNLMTIDPVSNKFAIPLSSSPEINDNRISAWFKQWTNYDLSLVTAFYNEYLEVLKAATGAYPVAIEKEKQQLPPLDINETGLTIAPGKNINESHRHLSPYMGIYPLNLLDIRNEKDKLTIKNSLHQIEKNGTSAWCGYSFSWLANIYARTKQGDSAAKMLQIFSSNFCAINSFHLNGDQKGGQYSSFTYRPFTLEGNFAFAQGVQEMLLQSHNGIIEIFPAIPADWKNISFTQLRTEGAFLISAKKENAVLDEVKIFSSQGGLLRLRLPFKTFYITDRKKTYVLKEDILEIPMKKGEEIILKNGYE